MTLSIVSDGQKRSVAGLEKTLAELRAKIEAEVAAEFAPRLQQAGFFNRQRLRWTMRFKIGRRIRQERRRLAPPDALYAVKRNGDR